MTQEESQNETLWRRNRTSESDSCKGAFAYSWELSPHGQAEFSEHTQLGSKCDISHANSCVDDALVSARDPLLGDGRAWVKEGDSGCVCEESILALTSSY